MEVVHAILYAILAIPLTELLGLAGSITAILTLSAIIVYRRRETIGLARIANRVLLGMPKVWLSVRQVTSDEDRDFPTILDLHKAAFPLTQVSELEDNFRRYLRQRAHALIDQDPCDDIVLVVKRRFFGTVIAYAFATHYPNHRFTFINYIAVDRAFADLVRSKGRKGLFALITHHTIPLLLNYLAKKTGFPNQLHGVIAELLRDETTDDLKTRFSIYASRRHCKIYWIDVPYVQPAIDAQDIDTNIPVDLIFIPGTNYQRTMDENFDGNSLGKPEVMEIIRFIHLSIYADAYKFTPDYGPYLEHMKSMVARYKRELPPIIRLHPLRPRRLEKRKRTAPIAVLGAKPC
jgi:hypothetical protein